MIVKALALEVRKDGLLNHQVAELQRSRLLHHHRVRAVGQHRRTIISENADLFSQSVVPLTPSSLI
jgi:hypothetical protein